MVIALVSRMTLTFGSDGPKGPKCPLLDALLAEKGMPRKASYTKQEVAKLFGCSERTIQEWVREGKMKVHKLPGGPRFFAVDLEEFLANSTN